MRRGTAAAIAAGLVLGSAFGSGFTRTAAAHTGKPDTQRIELEVVETDSRCGFPLRFQAAGVLIDRFWFNEDGSATEMLKLARGKFSLTNTANGTSLSSVDAENIRIEYAADGSATIQSRGLHLLFTVPGEGRVRAAVGRLVIEFPYGFGGPRAVTFEAGLHQSLYPWVCEYLD